MNKLLVGKTTAPKMPLIDVCCGFTISTTQMDHHRQRQLVLQ
ncbi:hypothetical protein [Thalassotalea euphylliae]|nr:hypothetical protein [Thalassotalea euphylliae]